MESCENAANSSRDDKKRGSDDERAEHQEQKLVHTLMILQRGELAPFG